MYRSEQVNEAVQRLVEVIQRDVITALQSQISGIKRTPATEFHFQDDDGHSDKEEMFDVTATPTQPKKDGRSKPRTKKQIAASKRNIAAAREKRMANIKEKEKKARAEAKAKKAKA